MIGALPYSVGFDLYDATSDGDPTDCLEGPGVWFAYTPGADLTVRATADGEPSPLIGVYAGEPGALTNVACAWGYDGLQLSLTAGSTYYFLVGSGYGWADYASFWLSEVLAPPANDTMAGATVITALPFSEEVSLAAATSDGDPDDCASGPGVWYAFTPTETTYVKAYAQGSYNPQVGTYDAGPSLLTCMDGDYPETQVLTAGVTYYFLVGSWTNDSTFTFTLQALAPPPTLTVTIDRYGTIDRLRGTATITGTVTCSSEGQVSGAVNVSQRLDRRTVVVGRGYLGDESTPVLCEPGTAVPWTVTVQARNYNTGQLVPFGAGKAAVDVTFSACNEAGCGEATASATVQLRGR